MPSEPLALGKTLSWWPVPLGLRGCSSQLTRSPFSVLSSVYRSSSLNALSYKDILKNFIRSSHG